MTKKREQTRKRLELWFSNGFGSWVLVNHFREPGGRRSPPRSPVLIFKSLRLLSLRAKARLLSTLRTQRQVVRHPIERAFPYALARRESLQPHQARLAPEPGELALGVLAGVALRIEDMASPLTAAPSSWRGTDYSRRRRGGAEFLTKKSKEAAGTVVFPMDLGSWVLVNLTFVNPAGNGSIPPFSALSSS